MLSQWHWSDLPILLHACSVAKSCRTLVEPHWLWPTRLLCPWDFPGKNTGVGCHFLLQGIFLTQGWNPGLLHWQPDSLPLSHPRTLSYPFTLYNLSHGKSLRCGTCQVILLGQTLSRSKMLSYVYSHLKWRNQQEKNHFMKCYRVIEVLYWLYLGTFLCLSIIHTGKAG